MGRRLSAREEFKSASSRFDSNICHLPPELLTPLIFGHATPDRAGARPYQLFAGYLHLVSVNSLINVVI